MEYDPHDRSHRRRLAYALRIMLDDAEFEHVPDASAKEEIYERLHTRSSRVVVRVYSSIVNDMVRGHGEDAIRVVAFDREAGRPLRKGKRVFRTGEVNAIVERTRDRMREVWGGALAGGCCRRCGAPLAVSKAGKAYCIDLCWKSA
jgi:hypothetical protein